MVRAVDIQDNLAKTQGAERVNQLQKSAPDINQHHTAQVAGEQHVQRQRETTPMERTDEVLIHRDRPKKEKEQKKNESKEPKEKKNEGSLDLTA